MIISASYKTDIPTFYGDWFLKRLHAGYCRVVNPYNGRPSTVSLRPEDVDGIVFWTKNLGPFLPHLRTVSAAGYPFVVQYTINGYPRELESHVADAARSVEHVQRVSGEYGPRRVVWRYDTIVITSLTDEGFHLQNFERLATALSGSVDEVVISYVHAYQKTLRNMQRAATEHGFSWSEPSSEQRTRLTTKLVEIAAAHGISLTICSQPDFMVTGAKAARCVDADRLQDIAGRQITARLRGNRKECGCFESRDIGDYDTCPHGCVYCYAVRDQQLAKRRYAEHDPESEFLFPQSGMDGAPSSSRVVGQLPLFSPPERR